MDKEERSWTFIAYVTAETVTGLIAIAVNGFVLLMMYKHRHLRREANYFIGSLALANVLVGIFNTPISIISETGHPNDPLGCLIFNSLLGCTSSVIFYSIVSIVVQNYVLIVFPMSKLSVQIVRGKVIKKIMIGSWTLSTLVGLAPVFGWKCDPDKFERCAYRQVIPLEYNVYLEFFGILLPVLSVIFLMHVHAFVVFRNQNKIMSKSRRDTLENADKRRANEIRLFKGLACIFIFTAIMHLPLSTLNAIDLLGRNEHKFMLDNSVPRPFVYF